MRDRDIASQARNTDTLYRVNDVLTDLAAEFGVADSGNDEWADMLNELTHHVAQKLGLTTGGRS